MEYDPVDLILVAVTIAVLLLAALLASLPSVLPLDWRIGVARVLWTQQTGALAWLTEITVGSSSYALKGLAPARVRSGDVVAVIGPQDFLRRGRPIGIVNVSEESSQFFAEGPERLARFLCYWILLVHAAFAFAMLLTASHPPVLLMTFFESCILLLCSCAFRDYRRYRQFEDLSRTVPSLRQVEVYDCGKHVLVKRGVVVPFGATPESPT